MSKNVKSENIQNAWLSAGMEIRGTARYIAYEKTRNTTMTTYQTTYLVAFGYEIDAQKPELREKMAEIANRFECYLFLDYANDNWHEGQAIFIHGRALREWKLVLESRRKDILQSFGYLQEQENVLSLCGCFQRAIDSLEGVIMETNEEKAFTSSEKRLRLHINEISSLHKNPAHVKEMDVRSYRMYQVLVQV